MPFSPETIAVKPYNQCIKCDYLGIKCDGPNVIAMSKERFCEWCKDRKDYLGWSNAKLAEVSGLSKSTVDKLIAGRVTGLNGETISTITCALIYGHECSDGNWGQFPCAMVAPEVPLDGCPKCEEVKKQMELQAQNDREKIDYLKNQIVFKDGQMVTKDKLLDERADFLRQKDQMIAERNAEIKKKDKTIRRGNLIIFVLSAVIVFAFIVDLIDRTSGFFFLDRLAIGLR